MGQSEHHARTRLALFLIVLLLLGATLILVYSTPIREVDAAAEHARYEDVVVEEWFKECENLISRKEFYNAGLKLRQILRAVSDHPRAYRLQARIELEQGRKDAAEKIYRRILYFAPLDEGSRNNLAVLCFSLPGRRNEAETEIIRAYSLRPDDPVIAYNYQFIVGGQNGKKSTFPAAVPMDMLIAVADEKNVPEERIQKK